MINIRAFKAVRPDPKLVSRFVVPPYDVLNYNDCLKLSQNNPDSFIRVTRSEVEFDGIDPYSPAVYQKASDNLRTFIDKGVLIVEEKPSIYVYEQTLDGRIQTGFVACVSIEDYGADKIKKHEKTRKEKEIDRIKHIETTMAHTEPSFMIYRNNSNLNAILTDTVSQKPLYDFTTNDTVKHRYWIISDKDSIAVIINEFKKINALYIADGHHRSQSSYLVGKQNPNNEEAQWFPAVIFPEETLSIIDYNRAVKDLNGHTSISFLETIKQDFIVNEVKPNRKNNGFSPEKKFQIGIYIDHIWYALSPKKTPVTDDPIETLDVYLLQSLILEPILGITDPRTDKRIDFFGGSKGTGLLKDIVDSKEFAVSFSMFPTTITELIKVADAGLLMPPKSTWFEPKLISGLSIHLLDE